MLKGETFNYHYSNSQIVMALIAVCDIDVGISIVDMRDGGVIACLLHPLDYKRIAILNSREESAIRRDFDGLDTERLLQYAAEFTCTVDILKKAIENNHWESLIIPQAGWGVSQEAATLACPAR